MNLLYNYLQLLRISWVVNFQLTPLIQVAMQILMPKMAEPEQDSINQVAMSLKEENPERSAKEKASLNK
jgi:hypothetical protein